MGNTNSIARSPPNELTNKRHRTAETHRSREDNSNCLDGASNVPNTKETFVKTAANSSSKGSLHSENSKANIDEVVTIHDDQIRNNNSQVNKDDHVINGETAVINDETDVNEDRVTFIAGKDKKKVVGLKSKMAAMSDVFAAMLNGGWREGADGVIMVPDVSPEALGALVRYADNDCKRQVELTPDSVWSILKVADKYQVIPVVQHCFRFLLRAHPLSNSPHHVCVVLELAHSLQQSKFRHEGLEVAKRLARYIFSSQTCLQELCRDCMLTLVEADNVGGYDYDEDVDESLVHRAVITWARCAWASHGRPTYLYLGTEDDDQASKTSPTTTKDEKAPPKPATTTTDQIMTSDVQTTSPENQPTFQELRELAGDLLFHVRYLTLPRQNLSTLFRGGEKVLARTIPKPQGYQIRNFQAENFLGLQPCPPAHLPRPYSSHIPSPHPPPPYSSPPTPPPSHPPVFRPASDPLKPVPRHVPVVQFSKPTENTTKRTLDNSGSSSSVESSQEDDDSDDDDDDDDKERDEDIRDNKDGDYDSDDENCHNDNSDDENCHNDNSDDENCHSDNGDDENCHDNSDDKNCHSDNGDDENCHDNSDDENCHNDNSDNKNCHNDDSDDKNCHNDDTAEDISVNENSDDDNDDDNRNSNNSNNSNNNPRMLNEVVTPSLLTKSEIDDLLSHDGSLFPDSISEPRGIIPAVFYVECPPDAKAEWDSNHNRCCSGCGLLFCRGRCHDRRRQDRWWCVKKILEVLFYFAVILLVVFLLVFLL